MADKAARELLETPLADALGERYLNYALSTIMARSLPDVRDGLKPVHRRLLFAMRELRLDPTSAFKKSARVVGDVIGKFHPHGDTAVYDALVRLAQDFAVRYPLIEGQGNFGNIDGDNPAAMRYTEARLTAVAEALLEGIGENAVDFRPTYDGEGNEPSVLPGRFPNLLANGAAGIAVGMATSIPPHNVGEICDALLHLIKAPRASIGKLTEFIKGPDLPTGGTLVEDHETIVRAYETGRGNLRLRARYHVEDLKHGQYQVVVTEIPYQVAKSRLVERVAQLIQEKKISALADVRDESADDVRLVLEPKSRNVSADVLMESLFRLTDLESRVSFNMNVLDGKNVPRVMNLREILQAFLDHRHDVLVRRTRFRLDEIARRLELVEGYLAVFAHLDAVIKIIRNEDEPKPVLMKRFGLSDVQAEAVLNMRLRALRKLEEKALKDEHAALLGEQKDLRALLKDEKRRLALLAEEVKRTRAEFGTGKGIWARRTVIGGAPQETLVPLEAMVEREPVTIVCSAKGWIRALRGHVETTDEIRFKEGDAGRFAVQAETTDKIVLFATNGRFYTLACDRLPGGRGHGEPVRLMIELGNDDDILAMAVHDPGRKWIVASGDGRGFVVSEGDVVAQTKNGKQVLNLPGGVAAAAVAAVEGDMVAVVGNNRKLVVFPVSELPEMSRGRGVVMQKYKDGGLSDVKTFRRSDGLTWKLGDRERTETDLRPWTGKRAQAGRMAPRGFATSNKFG